MKHVRLASLTLSVLFLSSPAQSADFWTTFHQVKSLEDSLEVVGVICEEVAKIELEVEEFPRSRYDIVTGIAYADQNGRVIGELDVVVFNRQTGDAELVTEVKCWKNLSGARSKATSQLKRFRDTLASGRPIRMYDVKKPSVRFDVRAFRQNPEFGAMAQLGAREKGFERELDLTLDELMVLRSRVMACQEAGQCQGPQSGSLGD
ncbi:MAG: hypothetical protein IT285_14200 [Bdellovibrionales bacterium]|nr:hypothetical protein [Bdellovibrionales bacterium]